MAAADCGVCGKGELSETIEHRGQLGVDGLLLGGCEAGSEFVEGDCGDEGHEVLVVGLGRLAWRGRGRGGSL